MVDRNRTPAQPDPAKHQRDSGIRVFGAGIVILGIIIAISGVLAMIAAVSDHTQPNPLVRGAVTPHEERKSWLSNGFSSEYSR